MKSLSYIVFLLMMCFSAFSQGDGKVYLRKGNKYYERANYESAKKYYDEALAENSSYFKADFNKGNALYRLENYDTTAVHFERLADIATNKIEKAYAHHNQGNALLQKGLQFKKEKKRSEAMDKVKESIEAYKNALRNNYKDEATRYNLAYAQKLLKELEEEENKDKDQKGDQNQDQDQKDQQKQEQEQNQEQQQNQDQNQQQNQDQEKEEQSKPNELSKEQAKRLLDALNVQEKNVQDKINKKKEKGVIIGTQKDW